MDALSTTLMGLLFAWMVIVCLRFRGFYDEVFPGYKRIILHLEELNATNQSIESALETRRDTDKGVS